MIAGEHKTIIEKGADFALRLKVTDGVGIPKDISGFTVKFTIKYDDGGTIKYIQSDLGDLDDDTGTPANNYFVGDVTDGPAGELEIVIDKDLTALMDPKLNAEATTIFSTQYNFFYSLDINHTGTSEDTRVLRGKLAIRN